jgi:hypothetical protein
MSGKAGLTRSFSGGSTMSMMPDEIKPDDCYRVIVRNGRRIIAQVLRLVDKPLRISEAENPAGRGAQSFTLNNRVVRFKWRNEAAKPAWSKHLRRSRLLRL